MRVLSWRASYCPVWKWTERVAGALRAAHRRGERGLDVEGVRVAKEEDALGRALGTGLGGRGETLLDQLAQVRVVGHLERRGGSGEEAVGEEAVGEEEEAEEAEEEEEEDAWVVLLPSPAVEDDFVSPEEIGAPPPPPSPPLPSPSISSGCSHCEKPALREARELAL